MRFVFLIKIERINIAHFSKSANRFHRFFEKMAVFGGIFAFSGRKCGATGER